MASTPHDGVMDHREQARAWLAEDPDPDTREELQRLLDLDDLPGLEDRFGDRLEFGTAGMRGAIGAGPNRMNRAMVRRVTAGLADRLNAAAGAGARGVVVGRDARHKSDAFEADTVRVLAGAGLGVWTFAEVVPTPVVAFAVRYLEAAAGVMITASHNPPTDNGYKVYGPAGRQIVPPLDTEISQAIDAVGSLGSVPLAPADDELIWRAPTDVVDHYAAAVVGLIDPDGPRDLRIVYTPMHGVAGDLCSRVLRDAGFTDVHVVPEQAEPDPAFPTVDFPNPEEPGAMDLAIAMATEVDADLILANDPDGDRIAVGIRRDGEWELLNGDEIGTLLAEDLLSNGRMTGGLRPAVGTTVVSSSLLARIAAAHDAIYRETLTGFKWLSLAAEELEDARMVLAYEQALGVTVGDLVRDKDGISAALCVADLAARTRAQGRTVGDVLDDMVGAYGAHMTLGRSVLLDDGEDDLVQQALDGLRQRPPTDLEGEEIVEVWDHDAGIVTRSDGSFDEIDLPATPLLRYVGADGTRVMVRPSGTEPKLKFYAEAVERHDDPAEARRIAEGRADRVLSAFMERTLPGG